MMADMILCREDKGEMRSAIEGIGDRRRRRVRSNKGVARCRFVYTGEGAVYGSVDVDNGK
jgi:hypothetical protein